MRTKAGRSIVRGDDVLRLHSPHAAGYRAYVGDGHQGIDEIVEADAQDLSPSA